jgi:hypothetical protein
LKNLKLEKTEQNVTSILANIISKENDPETKISLLETKAEKFSKRNVMDMAID